MTVTPEQEADRLLSQLAAIKPVLIGWRRGLAIRIAKQCKDGEPRKGWQDEAQEIINHQNAEVLANRSASP